MLNCGDCQINMVELKDKGLKEKPNLKDKLVELERELLELRMAKSSGQVKDTSRFQKLRAEISRLKLKTSQGIIYG